MAGRQGDSAGGMKPVLLDRIAWLKNDAGNDLRVFATYDGEGYETEPGLEPTCHYQAHKIPGYEGSVENIYVRKKAIPAGLNAIKGQN